jgi:hypothetical protein
MRWLDTLPTGARMPIIGVYALRIYLLPEPVDIDPGFNYVLTKI